ncbi:MAG: histidine phosphatase family protein [Bacteroidota bacterium]
MKKLILVRHGKSSWEYSVNDKDRPLKERGIRDAHLVSSELNSWNLDIDAVFSSPANRALHTCLIFLRQLDFPFSKFALCEALYDFSGDGVFSLIQNMDDGLETVMFFGHNHAFTHLVNSLGSRYIDNVPTSGMVCLEFPDNQWKSVQKGTTARVVFPKNLRQ